MENASKALLMAGGILIALLIVGALILMFTNLGNYQNSMDSSKKASQIADFNNQFTPYDKSDLTLMELKSIYNKIESNNTKNPQYEIKTNIITIYPDIGGEFKTANEVDKRNSTFKCTEIKYSKERKNRKNEL